MALTATVYNFDVSLSNVDRGVYEELSLQLARHPSESMPYLLMRLLAYCLEFEEGIEFSKGLSEADEPAVWSHDRTGKITLWAEVGAPKAERLHKASKLGARVRVYVHKDPRPFLEQLKGEKIFASEEIKVYSLPPDFFSELEPLIERRTTLSISVTEKQLYLIVAGRTLSCPITEHSLA